MLRCDVIFGHRAVMRRNGCHLIPSHLMLIHAANMPTRHTAKTKPIPESISHFLELIKVIDFTVTVFATFTRLLNDGKTDNVCSREEKHRARSIVHMHCDCGDHVIAKAVLWRRCSQGQAVTVPCFAATAIRFGQGAVCIGFFCVLQVLSSVHL